MPLITERREVLGLYEEAARKRWVIPCFCSENLTTTEAILAATKEYGDTIGAPDLPVTVAITNCYSHRSQTVNYSHTRQWEVGLRLFVADLKALTSACSPYGNLRVMLHLDHIQHDLDAALLQWDMSQFSSIMYDASTLRFEDNIRLTRKFVQEQGRVIVIEGACDEIADAGGGGHDLTTPENAARYLQQTGCDFIVANLGTEHRASAMELKYQGRLARQIKSQVGGKMVLHGASSVECGQLTRLFDDGICKVNVWTILERDSVDRLFEDMLVNAAKIVGHRKAVELQNRGLLGPNADTAGTKSLQYYAQLHRQEILFEEMKRIVTQLISTWYV